MRHRSSSLSMMDFTSGSPQRSDGDDYQKYQHRPHGVSGAQPSDLIMDSNRILHDRLALIVSRLQNRVSCLEDKLLEEDGQPSDAAAIDKIKSRMSKIHSNQKALKATNELILDQLKDVKKGNDVILAGIDLIRADLDDQAETLKAFEGLAKRQYGDNDLSVSKRNKYDLTAEKIKHSSRLERLGLFPHPFEEMFEDSLRPKRSDASDDQVKDAYTSLSGLNINFSDKEDRHTIGVPITAAEKLASLKKNDLEAPSHGHHFHIRNKMDLDKLAPPTENTSFRERHCIVCDNFDCRSPFHDLSDLRPSVVIPGAYRPSADMRSARLRGAEPTDS
ncbi:hypothetical protein PspLS_04486 [Pyricularia sp. CBS 133598]|nr:hypothetical protein PspLS_04486 [Pyricularia sp. CBS 133598]